MSTPAPAPIWASERLIALEQLEGQLQDLKDRVATEATLSNFRDLAAKEGTLQSAVAELQAVEAGIAGFHQAFDLRDLASETTAAAAKAVLDNLLLALDTVETKLQTLITQNKTEDDQTQVAIGAVQASVDALKAQNLTEDNQTQAKLDTAIVELQDIEADVVAVKGSIDAAEVARNADATALQARADLLATEATLEQIRNFLQAEREAELTERMRNDRPATGYRIWVEIDDLNHFYTLEAPAGSSTGDAVFRGIRVAKSVSGSPSGEIQVNAGGTLSWDNKTTDGGWA